MKSGCASATTSICRVNSFSLFTMGTSFPLKRGYCPTKEKTMLKFLNDRLLGTCIDEPAPPAGTPPAGTPPASDKPWHDGLAAEDVGYFQNRGWDKVDAKTAAINAAKAHREAEKLIGAPADKIIRLPNDPNDAEAWRQVRLRLGAPKDAKEYDFSTVKFADGTDLDEPFVT